jgi:hypothetical protein
LNVSVRQALGYFSKRRHLRRCGATVSVLIVLAIAMVTTAAIAETKDPQLGQTVATPNATRDFGAVLIPSVLS